MLQAGIEQYGKGDEKHQLPQRCAGNFHVGPSWPSRRTALFCDFFILPRLTLFVNG
jgi:hypothetical protein